ncbi:hypothetical protein WJX75_002172 [Coccomyxa subellipsoidea]|uniref:Uncharacterized protein n=1 Tax=Coccomyxa subellipsoidea TaxID=248742 RepID=A0ABR2YUW5_9CHLO
MVTTLSWRRVGHPYKNTEVSLLCQTLERKDLVRRHFANDGRRSLKPKKDLKSTTSIEQDTQGPTCAQELPDNGEMAVALCFGEAAAQLQLTKGGIRAISLVTTAAIWKKLVQKMAFFLDKVDAAPMDDHPQACLDAIVHEGGTNGDTDCGVAPSMGTAEEH